ncbi:MAG: ATP-binding cassette domain-containing protein [Candidatus Nezhaarchaeota archaeon]|nr:ATP-binding cassette domain-containing protein [Candidatus Nezhaarchaeota archaeon]
MTFIEVREVTKIYRASCGLELKALDNVNFDVEKGEFLGLLGESGSGKTTLIRVLRGVETIDGGFIKVGDVAVRHDSSIDDYLKLKRKTAIHLQRSFGLWSETALDNVIRALKWRYDGEESLPSPDSGEYQKLAEEALEILGLVGLRERSHIWAIALSGGEKQRLLLARQIAKRPEVLLLDEPATMSCPKTRFEVVKALRMVNDIGITILMASHMPEMHERLADRVIWLDKGRVVGEGRPRTLLRNFLSRLEDPQPKPLMPKRAKPVLRVLKVTRRYNVIPLGEVFALKEVNFKARTGEVTALIGPSGSGKTVIMRILAGLELPLSGEVHVKCDRRWIDITRLGVESMKARQKIGILHQEFALPHWSRVIDLFASRLGIKSWDMIQGSIRRAKELGIDVKVLDAIHRIAELPPEEAKIKLEELGLTQDIVKELFPAMPQELVEEQVKGLLEALRLPKDVLYRMTHELSGGEQVRVALALSLVSSPSILLLDEPFGDLDPVTARKAANALKNAVSRLSVSTVLVDHQLGLVEEVCHRGIVIDNGEMLYMGPIKASLRFYKKELLSGSKCSQPSSSGFTSNPQPNS